MSVQWLKLLVESSPSGSKYRSGLLRVKAARFERRGVDCFARSGTRRLTFTNDFSLRAVSGGARGTRTSPDSTGWPTGGIFAYDEVGGQPRITRLTPDTMSVQGVLLDATPGVPTEYFAYSGMNLPCAFGRLRTGASGAPALETLPCLGAAKTFRVVGVDRNGVLLAGNKLSSVDDGLSGLFV